MSTFTVENIRLNNPLKEDHGGTGKSSFTIGDILYADTTTTLAKLNMGPVNTVLTNNGTGPSWELTQRVPPNYESLSLTNLSQPIDPDVEFTNLSSHGIEWMTRIAGSGEDRINKITNETTGFYVIGYYSSNPLTIYNSDGTPFVGTLSRTGLYNTFIAKYDTSGFVEWVTNIKAPNCSGESIVVDSTGVYVTGYYSGGPLTAYNSDGTSFSTTIPNTGINDTYLVKYNTLGFVQWVTRISSNGLSNCISYDIVVDSSYIYIDGFYDSSLYIYNSDGTVFGAPIYTSTNAIFMVKYDDSGFAQWVSRMECSHNSYGKGMVINSTDIYITGTYSSSPLISYNSDGTSFVTTLPITGLTDTFLIKYNSLGFVEWVTRLAGNSISNGMRIASDSSGIYLTGGYQSNPLTIYNYDGTAFGTTLSNSGGVDAYIVKYNTSGLVQWVTSIKGTLADESNSIVSNSTGIYITGYYQSNPLTIYNSDGSIFNTTLPVMGTQNVFLIGYDQSGFVMRASRIGGNNSDTGTDIGADEIGIYTTGVYTSNPLTAYNPDGTLFTTTLPLSGNVDSYIIKYGNFNSDKLASLVDGNIVSSKVITNLYMSGYTSVITLTKLKDQGVDKNTISMSSDGNNVKLGWNGYYWYIISNNGAIIS